MRRFSFKTFFQNRKYIIRNVLCYRYLMDVLKIANPQSLRVIVSDGARATTYSYVGYIR